MSTSRATEDRPGHAARISFMPLAPLFAALLQAVPGAGCSTDTTACDSTAYYIQHITLSAAEYHQWQKGIPPGPGDLTGPASTGPSATSGGTSTGDATSTGDTTSTTGGGPLLTDQEICKAACDSQFGGTASCTIEPTDAGTAYTVTCKSPASCGGRRHACVRSTGAAAWLARAAHDEAASVHAFRVLAGELAALAAPAELLAELEAAAADELRHAAAVADLAARRGLTAPPLDIAETPARGLLALAVENAVEGCVHETWAALCAAHQARHARDPRVRAVYVEIAADEARHADLAWRLAAWLEDQLTAGERELVSGALTAAVRDLHVALERAPVESSAADLGLPDRAAAAFLLAGLEAALWPSAGSLAA